MKPEELYVEKELSWLSFNERVLQEAADKTVPLIERVRFLGIFSSNLDEFYKVRFANVKRQILIDEDSGKKSSSKKLLTQMQKKSLKLIERFDELYNELLFELARRRIFLVNETQLSDLQVKWVQKFFNKEVKPHITPLLLTDEIDLLQFLRDEYAYLSVELIKGDSIQYAFFEIPTDSLPRFIRVPEVKGKGRKTIIFLDNIIRLCIEDLFKGFFEYDEINCYSVTMTRDAEYDLSREIEFSLLEQMSEGIEQRLTAMPVRFIYEKEMPQRMLDLLCDKLKISDYDNLITGGRYHKFNDLTSFPNVGPAYLENKPMPPFTSASFDTHANYFDAIQERDILLYYPYHTFDHIVELVRQAAFDPKVLSIKINIYRVAKDSKLLNSLIDAVHNGKSVIVVVELQARFDEEANMNWSKVLVDAGVRVIFGAPGLKIHSKLLLISRREEDKITRYAHVGTGNFHEKTAKIYTDFALLTKNPAITEEVRNVFTYIQNPYQPVKFKNLIVSPRNSRSRIYQLIDNETNNANNGLPASITFKVNNLVDIGIVDRLYKAGQAGVKIKGIIRGMCSLKPGVKGLSDNITIISIIDRFLEHPRVFMFHNNGQQDTYISSADWMTRNIQNRIEVAAPILDPALKQKMIDIFDIQFRDRAKARKIDEKMSNAYVPRGNKKKIRSQVAIYDYLKQSEKEDRRQQQQKLREQLKLQQEQEQEQEKSKIDG